MATLNFPDAPDTGDTYSDANSGFEYEWNGTVWISKGATKRSNIQEIDDISGAFNGSTTDFILNVASNPIEPVNAQQVVISVGGVLQNVNDDYTIDGSTITFTTAPADGLTFFGTYVNPYLSVNTVGDNTVSTGSLVAGSNYTVGGINVTGVSTLTGLTYTGISSISDLSSSNLAVTGVGTIANVIHTKDSSGLGATMGAAVGIVTYFGDASNLTGVGATLYPWSYSPGIGTNTAGVDANIVTTWSSSIEGGSGTITIRQGSASGTVVDQFVVGSSSSITIAGNELTLNPAVDLSNSIEYFVTYPAGSIKALGGVLQNEQLIYSFTTEVAYQLWARGYGEYGEQGQNNRTNYSSPIQVGADTTWDSVHTGESAGFGAALKEDGTIWTWGMNTYGEAGVNDRSPGRLYISSPTQVGTDTTWARTTNVASGTILSIKTDGTLWSWGYNSKGNLALNDRAHLSSPTQVGTDTTWSQVSASVRHSGATKTDGTLWMWGDNGSGDLGQNQAPAQLGGVSSPVQVGTDTTWSKMNLGRAGGAAIKTDGTLWTWGNNNDGELGLNDEVQRSSPTQVSGTTWSSTSSGLGGTLATKTDGTLWAWGENDYGQLGQNSDIKYSSPTQIGTATTWNACHRKGTNGLECVASKTDGTMWVWGQNSDGNLGDNAGPSVAGRSSPTQLPGTNWGIESYQFAQGRDFGWHLRT